MIPGLVPRQKDEMVVFAAILGIGAVEPAVGRHVDLNAKNGFYARLFRLFVELDEAEKSAMVGDGHSRHLVFCRCGNQVLDADRAVEEAAVGMVMKMDKLRMLDGILWFAVENIGFAKK